MVSATMDLQDELDVATSIARDTHYKGKLINPEDGFASKVRKPYTITKQRERWSEEEHTRFLDALKLYGRAWRRIEAYVGTKTAVQIRSHAQKFFSKVTRDTNIGDGNSGKRIEIPPPRPKKKPMHPYPRKMASQVKIGISSLEKLPIAIERDNQSPISVLSGSDSSCGSPSSASSEAPKLVSDDVMSVLPKREYEENSSADEGIHMELSLSSQHDTYAKEDPNEPITQSLKLFGKTLLITGSFERKRDVKKISGFVPYKRCVDKRDSTLLQGESEEERRVRLCL